MRAHRPHDILFDHLHVHVAGRRDARMAECALRVLERAMTGEVSSQGTPHQVAAARALRPIQERQVLGRSMLLFDGVARDQLELLGEVRTPSIADLFVAMMDRPEAMA